MLTVIAFLVALGLLIAVHEYGHYRVAVACGVRGARETAVAVPATFTADVSSGCGGVACAGKGVTLGEVDAVSMVGRTAVGLPAVLPNGIRTTGVGAVLFVFCPGISAVSLASNCF